jgi:hypothetical protein
MDEKLLTLGFDRYQRFRAASQLVDQLAGNRPASILEIGGFDQASQPFLTRHQHTAWNGEIHPGQPLPFAPGQMEIVLALDVLEHVPPEERAFFISEISRVAERAVVLSFPLRAAQAAEAFVYGLTGSPWLAEHLRLGLPDPREIEDIFRESGLIFTCFPNAALPSWTAMMLLMYGLKGKMREQVSAFFNRHYYHLENREPAYRYIYVLEKRDGKKFGEWEKLLNIGQ